eukprot:scaffold30850_cov73-Phaeocystis_antarctica.AAC.2
MIYTNDEPSSVCTNTSLSPYDKEQSTIYGKSPSTTHATLSSWASCTFFRHFLKFDSEPPVEVYACLSLISGRSSVISTACSALVVPPSIRLAPSAVASVWRSCCISASVRAVCMRWRATCSARCLGVMLSWPRSRLSGGPTSRWGSWRSHPAPLLPSSNSLSISVSHLWSGGVASGGVGGVLSTASCTLWATTRCRATLTPATISGLARAGGESKMSCSDCNSSTTSTSAMKADSSAAVGSEPSSNPEAGAASATSSFRAPPFPSHCRSGGSAMNNPLSVLDGAAGGSEGGGDSVLNALLARGAEIDSD